MDHGKVVGRKSSLGSVIARLAILSQGRNRMLMVCVLLWAAACGAKDQPIAPESGVILQRGPQGQGEPQKTPPGDCTLRLLGLSNDSGCDAGGSQSGLSVQMAQCASVFQGPGGNASAAQALVHGRLESMESGQPLEGLDVVLTWHEEGWLIPKKCAVVSGPGGEFVFGGISSGAEYAITVGGGSVGERLGYSPKTLRGYVFTGSSQRWRV